MSNGTSLPDFVVKLLFGVIFIFLVIFWPIALIQACDRRAFPGLGVERRDFLVPAGLLGIVAWSFAIWLIFF